MTGRPKDFLTLLADMALAEDSAGYDITSRLLIPKNKFAAAVFIAKENGIAAGLPVISEVFKSFDRRLKFQPLVKDGTRIKKMTPLGRLTGSARSILAVERTALNILQKLSGIATLTGQYVAAVRGLPVSILDTRKTTPGLRRLEKYAVALGGGRNHRFHLAESILIKDNHLALIPFEKVSTIFQKRLPVKSEIEVADLATLKKIIAQNLKFDWIMLDNMKIPAMKKAVALIRSWNPRIKIEASGGVTLATVRQIAATGVDYISIGALTHSAPALDISLEIRDSALFS